MNRPRPPILSELARLVEREKNHKQSRSPDRALHDEVDGGDARVFRFMQQLGLCACCGKPRPQ